MPEKKNPYVYIKNKNHMTSSPQTKYRLGGGIGAGRIGGGSGSSNSSLSTWNERLKQRLESMSPEEREQFIKNDKKWFRIKMVILAIVMAILTTLFIIFRP